MQLFKHLKLLTDINVFVQYKCIPIRFNVSKLNKTFLNFKTISNL